MSDSERDELIETLDSSIAAFNQDGRLGRARATRRARRLTGMDWTYSALMLLEGLKDESTMRLSQLAESVGTTPPTVTKLIRDLDDKGLITKSPDREDGRASIVSLTPKGRELAESIGHARQESLREVLAEWSAEELERFTTLFERLRSDMRRLP